MKQLVPPYVIVINIFAVLSIVTVVGCSKNESTGKSSGNG
jgi:hypothetical protein